MIVIDMKDVVGNRGMGNGGQARMKGKENYYSRHLLIAAIYLAI